MSAGEKESPMLNFNKQTFVRGSVSLGVSDLETDTKVLILLGNNNYIIIVIIAEFYVVRMQW